MIVPAGAINPVPISASDGILASAGVGLVLMAGVISDGASYSWLELVIFPVGADQMELYFS